VGVGGQLADPTPPPPDGSFTVFFEQRTVRAITLIGIFSPPNRRISAQSSTDNTSLPPWLD